MPHSGQVKRRWEPMVKDERLRVELVLKANSVTINNEVGTPFIGFYRIKKIYIDVCVVCNKTAARSISRNGFVIDGRAVSTNDSFQVRLNAAVDEEQAQEFRSFWWSQRSEPMAGRNRLLQARARSTSPSCT